MEGIEQSIPYTHRMHVRGSLATEERRAWLRERLRREGSVQLAPTAKALHVSEMTVRRDLAELEAAGEARRVRGGAVASGPLPFADRHRIRAREKALICAKALPLVPTIGAVGFDASSTVLRLAANLAGERDLTVITNGIEAFQTLQTKPGVRAILTGGELDPRTGSLVGAGAARAAEEILLSHAFVSAAALHDAVGTSEAALEEISVKRALARAADQVILLADSSKLQTRAVAVALNWPEVSAMVTELDPSHPKLKQYRHLVRLI